VNSHWPLLAAAALLVAAPSDTSAADSAEADDRTALAIAAVSRLQDVDLSQNPKLRETVLKLLEKTRGTASFVKLVQQFNLTDQHAGLLEVAVAHPAEEAGVEALRWAVAHGGAPLLRATLDGTNAAAAARVAETLGLTGETRAVPLLLPLATDPTRDAALRKQAVRALAQTHAGAQALLALAREDKLGNDVRFTASSELNRARWPEIKAAAAQLLPLPPGPNAQPLPPVAELLKLKGDPANGAKVFASANTACQTCHQVRGQGTDFGPNLSEIGSKLGKDALYEAILDPSAGISFGYEAWLLQLKNGDEPYGLIVSETAGEVALKSSNGIVARFKKADIVKREQQKLSIMPAGLAQAMTLQELVDLIEYLASLRKDGAN
jgi:putative heme-binding domain-containing protein